MENRRSCKRDLVEFLDGNDDYNDKVYKFQILLPNGTTTRLTLHDPGDEMLISEFIYAIRKEAEQSDKATQGSRRKILWNEDIYLEDMYDNMFKKKISFKRFKANKCHIMRLHDGAGQSADLFHNMWDLTPDTDLLAELPAHYTFETALADLIDNSLQAVWSNGPEERRLIRVTVDEEKIVIFDSGPGMDGSEENSISKWGKMGSSNHRSSRRIAIGGKAPYLTPFFGMFGYGGPIASMHLGRHAIVSSKSKESRKVYALHLSREALLSKSSGKCIWRTDGGIRDPLSEEIALSPHGSYTQVEIHDLKFGRTEDVKLQCKLKDVYFPYIQCDEQHSSGKTTRPIEFQVNGMDLAEIEGGEVAVTNMHSCNGPDFILQLHFIVNDGEQSSKSPGSRGRQANARLKCVYFPIVEGKESIDKILEKLEEDGQEVKEDFSSFCRLSIRRLGRLLPDARWRTLPFMEFKKKGDKGQLLRRCCQRVKCFVDVDAGFSPTPSKTELAYHDPFTMSLRNFGNKPSGKESEATVKILKDGKPLSLLQLEKDYEDWIIQMHNAYDEEIECGEDEPVLVIGPYKKKQLGISADVVRVHQVIRRKGLLWKSGQKVKILKGAPGCWKNSIYATLEYILLEGFQGDAGGEARLICRPLGSPPDKGCLLVMNDGNASLVVHDSLSFPVSVIDNGKLQTVDDATWKCQMEKKKEKVPSTIDILSNELCHVFNIQGELPSEVAAGHDPPSEIVAVIRPSTYTINASKILDQKYIFNDDLEMSMEVKYGSDCKDFRGGQLICAERVKPSSRDGFHGLYIFCLRRKNEKLFHKAGIYVFSFSVICRDSSRILKEVKVTVRPASSIGKWTLCQEGVSLTDKPYICVRAGLCTSCLSVACLDPYSNRMPILDVPEIKMKIKTGDVVLACVDKLKVVLTSDNLSMEIEGMRIVSCYLDKIRPTFDAVLEMCSLGDEFMAEVPIKVMPGPISSVKLQCSPELEKPLRPDIVIEDLALEMLDAFGNHIEEGVGVHIKVEGFGFQDNTGSLRKVNDRGYVDLGGLLKVTAGYGSMAQIFVSAADKVIFEKVFPVAKRELKVVSRVPPCCQAGSSLTNVVFGIIDSDGEIDKTVHGHSHALTISSESLRIDGTVQYTFQHGRCTVPAIPVPENPGTFQFSASHTHYPDLCTCIEVHVIQAPKVECDPVTDSGGGIFQSQQLNVGTSPIPIPLRCSPYQVDLWMETVMDDMKELEEKYTEVGIRIKEHETKMRELNDQKEIVAREIIHLQDSLEPQYLTHADSLVNSKGQVAKRIEGRGDTAAAVFCNLSLAIQIGEPRKHFMSEIVGIVALIGTVSDLRLSSVFAEYLGESYMLAIVCKSYKVATTLEKYGENGKVDRNSALYEAAANLGITINRRFSVICLEEMRPYKGAVIKKDSQRLLALPKPLLPSGNVPDGFLGYAVNMINLEDHYLNTRAFADHGLRETLFYCLFGEVQVYETREQMQQAKACIKQGALSLDGGIMRANGIILLGDCEPEIKFPVSVPEVEKSISRHSISILQEIEEKKALLTAICEEKEEESKAHSKAIDKFQRIKEKYQKLIQKKSPSNLGCSQTKTR